MKKLHPLLWFACATGIVVLVWFSYEEVRWRLELRDQIDEVIQEQDASQQQWQAELDEAERRDMQDLETVVKAFAAGDCETALAVYDESLEQFIASSPITGARLLDEGTCGPANPEQAVSILESMAAHNQSPGSYHRALARLGYHLHAGRGWLATPFAPTNYLTMLPIESQRLHSRAIGSLNDIRLLRSSGISQKPTTLANL